MNENSPQQRGSDQRGYRHENGGSRGQRGGSRRNHRSGDARGPRRDDNSRSSRERSDYGTRETRPAKPLTLWQKIAAFFSGKAATPAPAAPASVHPTLRAERERSAAARPQSQRSEGGRPSDSYRRTEIRPSRDPREEASPAETPDSREPRAPREERSREPRTVEIVEVTSPKLYVGNLSFDAAESDLFDLFNGVGKVRNAEVVSNNYTQKSKGFAFVTMETIDEAKRAVVELHDKEFMGRKLLVSGAKTSERTAA